MILMSVETTKIIYVNGVNTTLKKAVGHCEKLTKILGYLVDCHFNVSMSLPVDLLESLYNRWHYLNFLLPDTPLVKELAERIEVRINSGCHDIVILGHSQGCVIVANALKRLSAENRKYCSAILFAPTNTQEPTGLKTVEYFLNDKDWVISALPGNYIQKGVKSVKSFFGETGKRKHGRVFLRAGQGHSFIEDYIDVIQEFDGYPDSLFYSMSDK